MGTERLDEILETAIYSGFVRNAIPISVILVGPTGAGKSKTLLRFECDSVHRCDDLTSSGLFDLMRSDEQEKTSHILLPDFNPSLSHRASTTGLTVASMLSLMSDGTAEIADGRQVKKLKHRPVGFLTAVTKEMYVKHLRHWAAVGLIRRFVPIFFTYTYETITRAQKAISAGKVTALMPDLCHVKSRLPVEPLICPEHLAKIESLSTAFGHNLGYRLRSVVVNSVKQWQWVTFEDSIVLPMSPQLILQTFIRAHALRESRAKTNEADAVFVTNLLDFTKPGEPVKL